MSQDQPPQLPDSLESPLEATPERSGADRRAAADRRASVVDRRYVVTGLERRRGPGRRRSDFVKAADEGELTSEQFLFLMAIDAYKRANQRPYPTWTEVLEVIRKLGYRKTCATALSLPQGEDWTERADAPAFAGGTAVEVEESHEGA
jgi:hypothetical protein